MCSDYPFSDVAALSPTANAVDNSHRRLGHSPSAEHSSLVSQNQQGREHTTSQSDSPGDGDDVPEGVLSQFSTGVHRVDVEHQNPAAECIDAGGVNLLDEEAPRVELSVVTPAVELDVPPLRCESPCVNFGGVSINASSTQVES